MNGGVRSNWRRMVKKFSARSIVFESFIGIRMERSVGACTVLGYAVRSEECERIAFEANEAQCVERGTLAQVEVGHVSPLRSKVHELLLLVIVIVNDFHHDYVTIECNIRSLPALESRVSVYTSHRVDGKVYERKEKTHCNAI